MRVMNESPSAQGAGGVQRASLRPRLRILFGSAVGDALGAATEFLGTKEAHDIYPSKKRLEAYLGPDGKSRDFQSCTDDTQLVIATLQAFLDAGGRDTEALIHQLLENYITWMQSAPPDMGMVIQRSLLTSAAEVWRTYSGSSAGNGALMRAIAVNAISPERDELTRLSVICGAVTHLDPISVMACLYFNFLIEELLETGQFDDSVKLALKKISTAEILQEVGGIVAEYFLQTNDMGKYQSDLLRAVSRIEDAVKEGERGELRGQGGFVLETLRAALAHNAKTNRFDECILRAARHGHDADTTAAVAGAIAAARGWRIPRVFAERLNAGHSWGGSTLESGWRREWPLLIHLPSLLDRIEKKREAV